MNKEISSKSKLDVIYKEYKSKINRLLSRQLDIIKTVTKNLEAAKIKKIRKGLND